MPIKHKLDRRRHGHAVSRDQENEDTFEYSEEEEDGDSGVADNKEEAPVSREDESVHDEDEEEASSEEEPDNPDDEDFEMNESSSQDNDSEEEEDYEPEPSRTSRRRRAPPAAAKRKSPRRRARRNPLEDDDLEEEDVFESDVSEEVLPTRQPRNRRGRSRRSQSSSEEEEYTPNGRSTRSSNRPQRRAQTRRRNYRDDSSSENDEDGSPGRRSTPSRASAKRANKKLHETLENEEEEDEEENDLPMLTPKKRKKGGSDEEEYVAGDNDEEDDEQLSAEDDNESFVDEKIENVDNESIGSMDDSDDGRNTGPSPALDIRPSHRRRRRQVASLDTSDDDASVSEFRTTSSSQQMVVTCPSTHDVITMDPLPEKHVCFVTPDGMSRQCFALETLHKIAMTSGIKQYRDDKQTFLQPPHFRSAMSDDLIDQIASRFGRAALDLQGYFYNQSSKPLSSESARSHEYDYITNFDGSLADTETFLERLNDYMSNLMGSQDIYCCPLCYTEAYRSLMDPDHSGDDESDQENGEGNDDSDDFVFSHDPMTILGSLDDDCFQLASTFCFTRIAEVKRHLRDAHHVDTSVLDGNGLFTRFKIRESDGLLQRYIDNCHWMAYQGSMRRYWNEGNNQMFIQLLHLMKRTQLLKKAIEDGPENEHHTINDADKIILDDAEVFNRSFEKRAKRVWEQLSAPYRKASNEELDDFIAKGDEGEEEGAAPVFNHSLVAGAEEVNPEDQIIAELQKRRRQSGQFSQNVSDADDIASEHDEPSEESDEGSNYSEGSEQVLESSSEDEDDDEWVKEVRGRRKARGKPTPKARGKRLGKRKTSGTPVSSVRASQPVSSSSRKQRRIAESDEDDY